MEIKQVKVNLSCGATIETIKSACPASYIAVRITRGNSFCRTTDYRGERSGWCSEAEVIVDRSVLPQLVKLLQQQIEETEDIEANDGEYVRYSTDFSDFRD